MKKNLFFGVIIVLMFLIMYGINRNAPRKFRWEPTYDTRDTQPYGAFVFDKLLKTSWEEGYTHSYESILDLYSKGDLENANLLIICADFDIPIYQEKAFFDYLEKGGNILIASSSFRYSLSDSLNFYLRWNYSSYFSSDLSLKQPITSAYLWTSSEKDSIRNIPKPILNRTFSPNDGDSIGRGNVSIMATSSEDEAIMLRYEIGEGNLILCSTPLLFTNYAILHDSVNPFIWNALAPLKGKPLIRTEYYGEGRSGDESDSVFRYLLSQPSLKWAFYIVIGALILFMLFTIKRKQKIIPIIKPPENRMLDFVRSISALYLTQNNNADIVLKRYIYWGDALKKRYGIDIINEQHDKPFIKHFSMKTGMPENDVRSLFLELDAIREHTEVSDTEMMNLITKMKID